MLDTGACPIKLKPMTNSDQLRTTLANERTFLAYIRTALSAWIFGLAALKFFPDDLWIHFFGWVAIALGIFVLLWGSYISHKRNLLIQSNQV